MSGDIEYEAGNAPVPGTGRPWEEAGPPPSRKQEGPTWAVVLIVIGLVLVVLCCTAVTAIGAIRDPEPPRRTEAPVIEAPSSSPSVITPEPEEEEPGSEEEEESDLLDLGSDVEVRVNGTGLVLTNQGQSYWTGCEFELNGAGWGTGWEYSGFELYPAGTEGLD